MSRTRNRTAVHFQSWRVFISRYSLLRLREGAQVAARAWCYIAPDIPCALRHPGISVKPDTDTMSWHGTAEALLTAKTPCYSRRLWPSRPPAVENRASNPA